MNGNNLHDKIDKYLDAHLSEEEQDAFEREMSENPLLLEEVKKHRLEREALHLLLKSEYAQKIKDWTTPIFEKIREEETPRPGKIVRLYPYLRKYAAVLTGILLVGSLFVWSQLRFSNSAIYAQNFTDPGPHLLDAQKSASDVVIPADSAQLRIDQAKEAYKNKQYTRGIKLLKDLSPSEAGSYLLGHFYLAQKEYGEAVLWFRQVSVINGAYRPQAEYYLLLAMLQDKQTDDAFYRLLNVISNDPEHPYQRQAARMQKSLKTVWRKMVWE